MMSDELVETLTKVMGVVAHRRQGDEFLDDRWVSKGEIDTCLIETDGTDSVGDGADDLELVNEYTWRAYIVSRRVFLLQLCV